MNYLSKESLRDKERPDMNSAIKRPEGLDLCVIEDQKACWKKE